MSCARVCMHHAHVAMCTYECFRVYIFVAPLPMLASEETEVFSCDFRFDFCRRRSVSDVGCRMPARLRRLNSAASTAKTLEGAGTEEDCGLLGGRTVSRGRLRSLRTCRRGNEEHTRRGTFQFHRLLVRTGVSLSIQVLSECSCGILGQHDTSDTVDSGYAVF